MSHAENLELLPLDRLRPAKRNPRTHSPRQVELLAKSIQAHGFVSPIIIDEADNVLAGHGRLLAARSLKLETAPCRRLVGRSPEELRAFALADNAIAAKAGWDKELLALELEELSLIELDLELTGFEQFEVDTILFDGRAASPSTSDVADEQPPPPAQADAVTRPGDGWQLGRHRLVCGDAKDADLVRRLMGDDQADAIFTDPPYNVPITGHVCGLGKVQHREFAEAVGEMSSNEFTAFLKAALAPAVSVARDGAIAFVCMDWRHIAELTAAGAEVFDELKNVCVWAKTNAGMGTFYRSQHELVFAFKVGQAPHINNFGLGDKGRYRTNVWSYAGVNSFRKERDAELAMHPTVKPVALVADAIRDVTHRKGIVLDPFGGSGTTLIAAEMTGRRAHLIEIDPSYCDVIVRRWQAYTGKSATVGGGSATFDEAALERRAVGEKEAA